MKEKEEMIIQLKMPMYELKVNKKIYNIDIGISFERMEKYFEDCKKNSYKESYYKMFFEDIDLNEMELTQKQKDELFNKVLKENGLKKIYNTIDSEDIFERFYKALKKQIDIFPSIIIKKQSYIQEFAEKYIKQISQIYDSKMIKYIYEDTNSVLESLKKVIVFNKSDFDEKKLKKMELNYEKWAEFGWTLVPSGPVFLFSKNNPINQKEADEICLKYLKEDLGRIISSIKGKVKHKKDYEEAMECYNLGYYIATAMILTSIIEREIMEFIIDKEEKKPKTSKIAFKYKEKCLKYNEDLLNYYLIMVNLCKFLERFFEYGNDFIEQVDYLNRNFLMHGWRDLEITKIDCIKLFLCLYNIIFLNSTNEFE